MSKMTQTTYGNTKNVLKFNEFTAVGVTVDNTGITANAEGKKIVPAGTIVGGKTKAVLLNPQEPVVSKNTAADGANAEGVLLNDVDVTYGAAPDAMVIFGFIDINKMPEPPADEAKAALTMIKFMM